VGKRSLYLMDIVNAKKRWMTIYWRVNKFLKQCHIVTRLAKERVSFLKINDINDISFLERLLPSLLFYSVSGNANCMVKILTTCIINYDLICQSQRVVIMQNGDSLVKDSRVYCRIKLYCFNLNWLS
jgi:hypothetical protein